MKTQKKPETLADLIVRSELRTAKNLAAGAVGIGDAINMAINPIWTRLGGEELGMPSQFIRESADTLTGGLTKPRNMSERFVDTATEFASPGGITKLASKVYPTIKALQKISPQTTTQALAPITAGIGVQGARELYPNSTLAEVTAGLIGGLAPGGASAVAKGAAYLQRNLLPSPSQAAMNNYRNIDLHEATAAKEAGERLGFQLRPSETTGNPFVAAHEGQSGIHPSTAEALYQAGKKREPQISNAIEDLYSTIAPAGTTDKTKALYSKADPIVLPDETFTKLMQDEPKLAKTLRDVLKDVNYQSDLKGFQQNSTKVLDRVKRVLDDQIQDAPKQLASVLRKTRKKLVDALDEVNPTYKQARKEAQKDAVVNKIKDKIGSTNKGGTNFYKKILKDDKSFKDIYRSLEGNPDAQRKLVDMRTAFKNLIEPISTKQAAAQAKVASKTSGPIKFAKDLANKLTNGLYDKAAVDLILDPQWDKRLKAAIKIKNPDAKAQVFESLLNDVQNTTTQTSKGPQAQEAPAKRKSPEELQALVDKHKAENPNAAPVNKTPLSAIELQALVDKHRAQQQPQ